MIVRDLNGRIHKWNLNGFMANANTVKSELHLSTRSLLHKIYPTVVVLEEVTIPIRNNQQAFLDFYIPLYKLAVEVHGLQHYEFSKFYHGNQQGWLMQQKRDREKRLWCENNNIRLVELPCNDIDNWENLIRGSNT